MDKNENQGQDNRQGREKEKTSGWMKNKGVSSNTSPNNNPGVYIRQARVPALQITLSSFSEMMISLLVINDFLNCSHLKIAKKVANCHFCNL